MSERLRTFYEREINEIKNHKVRISIITAILMTSLVAFILSNDNHEASAVIKDSEKLDMAQVVEPNKKSEKSSTGAKQILGLEEASNDVQLINPFKVDLPQPPTSPMTVTKAFEPPPPVKALPITNTQSTQPEKIILILKGTAISGNKKIAIIQYGNDIKTHSSDDNNSKSQNKKKSTDKNKPATKMLTIGDKIEGRQVMEIGKNFIIFDDGEQLNLEEG